MPESQALDRVRAQLLTALHTGRLRPGDRVPSVRRLADLTGLNRKTVHRAYSMLARDGLLDIRHGSGTFLAEPRDETAEERTAGALLSAVNRCRAEARRLRLEPAVFSRFVELVLGDGLRGLPVVVTECNGEQTGLIALELRASLGVSPRPVLLQDLVLSADRALAGASGVVTTACHREEVEETLEGQHLPVHQVVLDPGYPRAIIEKARRGPVVLVVSDGRYAPVFHRLLERMEVPAELRGRVHLVEPAAAASTMRRVANGSLFVYVSPLVRERVGDSLGDGFTPVSVHRHLDPSTLERVRTLMALDLARRGRSG